MSAVLFGRKPIVVSAEMVAEFGPLDAIVIQQVHYWRGDDGWSIGGYGRWSSATGLSRDQVHRALTRLRGKGILDCRKATDDPRDQTLAYRISEGAMRDMHSAESPYPYGDSATVGMAESPDVPSIETVRENTERTTSSAALVPLRGTATADFDEFWSVYPRKVGKPKARDAFARAVKRANDPRLVILGAMRYRDDPNREEQYTAHPTTWLNRDGWLDPPLPSRGGRRNESKRQTFDRLTRMANEVQR